MPLLPSDVRRIAQLSKLAISDDQANATLEQLNGIFALVEQMNGIDTTNTEPLSHPIAVFQDDLALRLRDDVVSEPERRLDYQRPAPAVQDGLYLVPKVLD